VGDYFYHNGRPKYMILRDVSSRISRI